MKAGERERVLDEREWVGPALEASRNNEMSVVGGHVVAENLRGRERKGENGAGPVFDGPFRRLMKDPRPWVEVEGRITVEDGLVEGAVTAEACCSGHKRVRSAPLVVADLRSARHVRSTSRGRRRQRRRGAAYRVRALGPKCTQESRALETIKPPHQGAAAWSCSAALPRRTCHGRRRLFLSPPPSAPCA